MTQSKLIAQRYQVTKQLGSGGFGDTFLAQDLYSPSQKACVVKQLRRIEDDPATYQVVQERFNREALILEDLGKDYPRIPALYAYFEEDGFFYLVQEYIEGMTLSELVEQQGAQSEDFTLGILRQVLEILQYVHGRKIIHRDIKPDNILLRKTDQSVVLIDFGAIKEVIQTRVSKSGSLKSSIVIGTPGFMSPEQGIGRPSFSSDLYSLGLVGIYLLTGKLPDEFPTDPATGKMLWQHGFQNSYAVNEHVLAVLEQSIQSHMRDRFSTAQAMMTALQAQAVNVPMPPPAPIAVPPTSPIPNPTYQPTVTVGSAPGFGYSQMSAAPGGMSDWQKAILTGGIIGAFLVGGIVLSTGLLNRSVQTPVNSNGSEPEPVQTTEPTPSTKPVSSSEPPKPAAPAISNSEAANLIADWLSCKIELFDYPYNRSCGTQILTAKAFNDNIRRNDGKQSSVEWLESNGAYYAFSNQVVEGVRNLQVVDSQQAIADVVVTERRTLYDYNGNIDKNASGYDQRLVRYNLKRVDGSWKIADYNTLEVLWRR